MNQPQDHPPPDQPAPSPEWQPAPYPPMSGLAIASMVLGILWLWWIGSLLAVIFGHVSLSQCRQNPYMRGRGFAIAGVALGWVGLGFLFLGIIGCVLGSSRSIYY